jgi:hypothetical protein
MDPTHVRTQSDNVDETLPPPAVAPPVVGRPAVPVEPVVVDRVPVAAQYDTVRTSRQFSAPAAIAGIVGVALLIMGLIACLRAGFGGPLNQPVVQVLGFAHTATLGIVDVGAGIVLLLAAVGGSRGVQIFSGVLLGVFGVVAAAEPTKLQEQLAIEKSYGVLLAIAGIVIVLAAALLPNYARYVERTARSRV